MGDAEEERARSGDEAEAAAEGAEEESIDYDALPFNDVAYWQHFYQADDEMDFYCWYSADEWLPQATERVGGHRAPPAGPTSRALAARPARPPRSPEASFGPSPPPCRPAIPRSDPPAGTAIETGALRPGRRLRRQPPPLLPRERRAPGPSQPHCPPLAPLPPPAPARSPPDPSGREPRTGSTASRDVSSSPLPTSRAAPALAPQTTRRAGAPSKASTSPLRPSRRAAAPLPLRPPSPPPRRLPPPPPSPPRCAPPDAPPAAAVPGRASRGGGPPWPPLPLRRREGSFHGGRCERRRRH